MSTTAHCASSVTSGYRWVQVSLPYSISSRPPSVVDIGRTSIIEPAPVACNIAGAATQPSSCRRGDQSYAHPDSPPAFPGVIPVLSRDGPGVPGEPGTYGPYRGLTRMESIAFNLGVPIPVLLGAGSAMALTGLGEVVFLITRRLRRRSQG